MILIGPESALQQTANVIGSLSEAATYIISVMSASPQDEVALIALAPAACAPMQVDMAECSLSTGMNSVSTSPLST